MKLFSTSNITVVKDCQYFFEFELPSNIVRVKFQRFLQMNFVTSIVTLKRFVSGLLLYRNRIG